MSEPLSARISLSTPSSSTPSIASGDGPVCGQSRFGIFPECPLCGGALHAEHAHFKCGACGWRDSCCD